MCFNVKRTFANNPIYHLPKTHYSIIPFFHYSNCERSELSSSYKTRNQFDKCEV